MKPESPESAPSVGLGGLLGRIGRQSGAYALASVVGSGTGLLLLPVYTRYLAPAEFGLIALLEVVALVLGAVFSLGIPAFVSFLFVEQGPSDKRRRAFGSLLVAVTVVNVALAGAAWLTLDGLLSSLLPSVPFWPYVPMLIAAAVIEPYWTTAGAMLQIQERAGLYSVLSLARILTSATLRLLLVAAWPLGVVGFTWANVLTSAIFALVGMLVMRKEVRPAFDVGVVRQALAVGGPAVPNNLLSYGFRLLDRVVLERIGTLDQVGLYYLAMRIADVMRLASDVFVNAWRPVFFKEAGTPVFRQRHLPEVVRLASVGLVSCFVALSLAAPAVVWLFMAPSYAGATRFVPLLVAAMAVKGFYAFPAITLWYSKKTVWIPALSAITLGFAVIANFALVAQWGVIGVAAALFLSHCCLAALVLAVAQRLLPIRYPWRVLISAAGWGAVVVFAGEAIEADAAGALLRVALLVVYVVGLLLLRCIAWHEIRAAFTRAIAFGRVRFATS